MTKNAWGENVTKESDVYRVHPDQRLDTDEGPGSNALGKDDHGDDTGDDLEGWNPEDEEE